MAQKIKWTKDAKYFVRFKRINGKQVKIYQHREVWEKAHGTIPADMQIDHINHDGLDNRLENLRLVTVSQNQHNRIINKNNSSGYKGVYFHKQRQKWHAEIMIGRKKKSLGLHEDPEDAHRAYLKASEGIFSYV